MTETEPSAASRRSIRPGGWFGIFGDQASVLLPPSEKHRVAALWELVDEGAGFDEVLDALLAHGLRDLPGFVLLSETDGPVKVVLRGPVRATFWTDDDEIALDGSVAATWVERSLEGVVRSVIEVEEAPEGSDLTMVAGLVRVARVDDPPRAPESVASVTPLATPVEALLVPEEPDDVVVEEPLDGLDVDSEDSTGLEAEAPSWAESLGESEDFSEPEPLTDEEATVAFDPAGQPEPEPEPDPDPDPLPAPVPVPAPGGWAPAPEDNEHDGMTHAGDWDDHEFARQRPGIPGQQQAPDVVSKPVAKLVISSGETVEVDRAVIVGRAPEARRFTANEQPRLVTVPSPHQEISSTHLEVRPGSGADHGSAVVTDMGSTNGTVLVQPGLSPEDLQPGIAVQLIPGAIIDLGDGVTIQVTNP